MTSCPAHAFHGCLGRPDCDRPCSASDKARQQPDEAAINWPHTIITSIALGLITAAVLFCVAAVIERGAENIRNTITANREA